MPRINLRYNSDRVLPADLQQLILRNLRQIVAHAVSTDMGPVIDEDCTLWVAPFGEFDQPMKDIEVVIAAHNFADRRGDENRMAEIIKAHLITALGSRGLTVGTWLDLIDMGYAEFPDRTK